MKTISKKKTKIIIAGMLLFVMTALLLTGCNNQKAKEINFKKSTRYNGDGKTLGIVENELDRAGRVVKETTYEWPLDGDQFYLFSLVEYEYNEDGLETLCRWYDTDDENSSERYISAECKYEYENGNGAIIKSEQIYYNKSGEVQYYSYCLYEYDKEGRAVREDIYEKNADSGTFELFKTTEHTYSGNFDTPVKSENFIVKNGEKTLNYTFVSTLDDKGRTIEHTSESDSLHMKEAYKYGENDLVCEKTAYYRRSYEDEWEKSSTTLFTYNEDGKETQTYVEQHDGSVNKSVTEYDGGKKIKYTNYIKEPGDKDFWISSYTIYEY